MKLLDGQKNNERLGKDTTLGAKQRSRKQKQHKIKQLSGKKLGL